MRSTIISGLASATALCLIGSNAMANTKSMQCERYQVSETSGLKEHVFAYSITADFKENSLTIDLTKEPETDTTGQFPIAVGSDWRVIWQSDDQMRVVALVTRYSDNFFDSPVMILDVDFAKVRSRHREAGGFIDLDEVVNDPWKYECARLD